MLPRASASSVSPPRPLGRSPAPPPRVPIATRLAGAVPTAIANLPPRPATACTRDTRDTRRDDAATAIRRVSICSDDSDSWPLGSSDDALFLKAPSGSWPLPPANVSHLRPAKPL
ncbi:hypothetical protein CXF90_16800 [Stenotrophomonas sp. Betaine-02u-23]|nr:hypothetical protein CXF90_16800 [Stenotrophomonas sp. Betaine-02u-23]